MTEHQKWQSNEAKKQTQHPGQYHQLFSISSNKTQLGIVQHQIIESTEQQTL